MSVNQQGLYSAKDAIVGCWIMKMEWQEPVVGILVQTLEKISLQYMEV
jgi:hypothetical protein